MKYIFLIPLLMLSACGGSSEETTQAQLNQFSQDIDSFFVNYDRVNANSLRKSLPTTGNGRYDGEIGMGYSGELDGIILGDLGINVSFNSGNVTGGVNNMRATDGTNVATGGSLAIVNGNVNTLIIDGATIPALEADLFESVNLPTPNGGAQSAQMDIQLIGVFGGGSPTSVPTVIIGDVQGRSIGGPDVVVYDGDFYGE